MGLLLPTSHSTRRCAKRVSDGCVSLCAHVVWRVRTVCRDAPILFASLIIPSSCIQSSSCPCAGYLCEFTGQPIEKVTLDCDRDFFQSAAESAALSSPWRCFSLLTLKYSLALLQLVIADVHVLRGRCKKSAAFAALTHPARCRCRVRPHRRCHRKTNARCDDGDRCAAVRVTLLSVDLAILHETRRRPIRPLWPLWPLLLPCSARQAHTPYLQRPGCSFRTAPAVSTGQIPGICLATPCRHAMCAVARFVNLFDDSVPFGRTRTHDGNDEVLQGREG